MGKITGRQIDLWIPAGIHDFVGCAELKQYFGNLIAANDLGLNTLIVGDSNTGKTAFVKAFVRAMCCSNLNKVNSRCCGVCEQCKIFDIRYDHCGIFADLGNGINYFPVNCADLSPSDLDELCDRARGNHGRTLLYLDEAHRLAKRELGERLLVPLRELDAVILASATTLEGLDVPFRNRFRKKCRTSLPSQPELALFLEARCNAWQITYDTGVCADIAKRSRCVPGDALGILAVAATTPSRHIDAAVVANHRFDYDET